LKVLVIENSIYRHFVILFTDLTSTRYYKQTMAITIALDLKSLSQVYCLHIIYNQDTFSNIIIKIQALEESNQSNNITFVWFCLYLFTVKISQHFPCD